MLEWSIGLPTAHQRVLRYQGFGLRNPLKEQIEYWDGCLPNQAILWWISYPQNEGLTLERAEDLRARKPLVAVGHTV